MFFCVSIAFFLSSKGFQTQNEHAKEDIVAVTMPTGDIRGAFNKFPDFFVQAFKIVVDSWKFTILLLYILWEDWPNEQQQQQLEYTLVKPDCHSWWISKMQSDMKNDMQ